jgi:hypothetical protein
MMRILNASLTEEERIASARRAALARWGGKTEDERKAERARGRQLPAESGSQEATA